MEASHGRPVWLGKDNATGSSVREALLLQEPRRSAKSLEVFLNNLLLAPIVISHFR